MYRMLNLIKRRILKTIDSLIWGTMDSAEFEVKLKNHEYDGQPAVRDIKVKLAKKSNDEWREKVNSSHETEAPIVCRRFDVL